MEWINVKDELPRMLQSVLISVSNNCADGLVHEAMHQMDGEFICVGEIAKRTMRPSVGVTHWMPLPEPPSQ